MDDSQPTHADRRSARHFSALLDALDDKAIFATDRDGLVTVFNRAAERRFGLSASEVVGRLTPLAFFAPQAGADPSAAAAWLREAADLGLPCAGAARHGGEGRVALTVREIEGGYACVVGDAPLHAGAAPPRIATLLWRNAAGFPVVCASEGAEALLGCRPGELAGPDACYEARIVEEDRAAVLNARLQYALDGHAQWIQHYRVRCGDGGIRQLLDCSVVEERDAGGWPTLLRAYLFDETESGLFEGMLSRIADKLPGVIFQLRRRSDGRGDVPYISEGARAVLGHSPHHLRDNPALLFERIHPDDLSTVLDSLTLSAQRQTPWQCEFRARQPGGRELWLDACAQVESEPDGATLWSGVLTDISDRKRVEAALKESEGRFRELFRGHDAVMLLIDPDRGVLIDANDAASRFYGYTAAELIGMPVSQLNRLDTDALEQAYQSALRQERNAFVFRHQLADGSVRVVEVHASPIVWQGRRILFSIIHDITARAEAERALARSEARYRETLAAIDDGMWEWDIAAGRVQWDARCYELLGYPDGAFEIGEASFATLLNPADQASVSALLREQLGGSQAFRVEMRLRAADGGWRWIESRGRAVAWDDAGRPTRAVGTHSDISRRKAAEEALRETHLQLETVMQRDAMLLSAAGEGIYGTDRTGRIMFANPMAQQLLGYREDEMIGRDAHQLFHHSHREGTPYPAAECPSRLTLTDCASRHVPHEWYWRKDGHGFPVSLTVSPLREGEHTIGTVVVFQDNSERDAAEEALRIAQQRLSTVIENFQGGVLLKDERRRIVLANQTFCDLFAVAEPPSALLGRDGSALVDEMVERNGLGPAFVERLESVIARGEAVYSEEWSLADGRVLERDYLPIRLDGVARGHLWLYRDITERKRHEIELRRLATTDPLTGLPNRRYFMDRLEQEFARFARFGQPAAVLMLDIDHFKRVNDRYGHAVGDELLRRFAEGCQKAVRRSDLVGRLGGEEFAALLPGCERDGALELAERLRRAVDEVELPADGEIVRATVSVGVALFTDDADSADTLLVRADGALYRAKQGGRNRVVLFEG